MTSLQLYRLLIPGHAAAGDPLVTAWLTFAAIRLTPSAWGAVYAYAVVFYAAHSLEVNSGAAGTGSDGTSGQITAQTDGDLSRTYAAPPSSGAVSAADAALASTPYGQSYLDLRASRAAGSPTVVAPW